MPASRKEKSASRQSLSGRKTVSRKPRDEALFMTEVSNVRKDSVLSGLSSPDIDFDKDDDEKEEQCFQGVPESQVDPTWLHLQILQYENTWISGGYQHCLTDILPGTKKWSLCVWTLWFKPRPETMNAQSTSGQKHSLSNSVFASPRTSRGNGVYVQTAGGQEKGQGGSDRKLPVRKIGIAHLYRGYHFPETDDDRIFELDEEPRQKLGADEIKLQLYRRECRQLDVTPVGAYLRSPSSPVLTIKHYSLGPRGARALAVPLMLDSCIVSLDLEGNDLGGEGAKNLMEALSESCSITDLNLSNNKLGSAGADVMERILMQNNLIQSVTLSGNHFKDGDAVHFARVLTERKILKTLNLSHNEFGDSAAVILGQAFAINDTLESLNISWNHIRPKGGKAFMGGIKENVGLKRLSVSNNGLGDEGCGAAAVALSSNSSLLELDISGNRITNTGFLAIASCIKSNETLQVLRLGNNLGTGLGAQTLGEAIVQSELCAVRTLDLTNISVWTSLVDLLRAHAQTRPLKVLHGAVTRREIPRDQLEQTIKEDIIATFKTRENDENLFTEDSVEILANELVEPHLTPILSKAQASPDALSDLGATDGLNVGSAVAADDSKHMPKDAPSVRGNTDSASARDVSFEEDTEKTKVYLEGQIDNTVISDTGAPADNSGENVRKSAGNPEKASEELEGDEQEAGATADSVDEAAS